MVGDQVEAAFDADKTRQGRNRDFRNHTGVSRCSNGSQRIVHVVLAKQ